MSILPSIAVILSRKSFSVVRFLLSIRSKKTERIESCKVSNSALMRASLHEPGPFSSGFGDEAFALPEEFGGVAVNGLGDAATVGPIYVR